MNKEEHEQAIALCAYKEELTDEENATIQVELERCKASFVSFLRWVKIIEPPTLDNSGGIIPLELWEHLKVLTKALMAEKLIVLLKSRQIGASWFISAYDLWYVLFHQGAQVMIFSKGKVEAIEKLAKCRRIYEQLPSFLCPKLDPDSATEIGFPAMKSCIKAFAATETAGISFTASVLDIDEWAEHPFAVQNYMASKPTRDAGGQLIGTFTANPWEVDTLASAIFQDAMDKKNDFIPLFFPYHVRPGRDREWYEHTRRNIPEGELAGLTPDLYMAKNYPSSIEEALSPAQTLSAFDHRVLGEMMGDTRNPITIPKDGIDPNIVKIYQPFYIGEFYIAGTDTSHGVGKDFSVTTVMNVKTGTVVADIMHNLISPEELALHSVRMLELYQNPLWYIECNDRGAVTIATAQTLGYKRFGYQDDKKTKIGFNTTGYKTPTGVKGTRTTLYGELIAGINNHQIKIYNSKGLKQFYDIIRNASKEGRIEASGTRHDDYPIAVGICWCKKGEIHTEEWKPETIESLHWRR